MAEKAPAVVAPPSASTPLSTPESPETVTVHRKSSFGKVVLVLVLTVVGGAGVLWFFLGRGQQDASANAGGDKALTVIHLEGFTVNLADPEDNHFLRVSMDLAIDRLPPPVERGKPNSGLPMAHIRDSILSVLTVGKAETLLTPEGKQQLKKNLLDVLNRENPELGVREIYFTEFLVQR
jgi:flagellar FliL protein